MTMTPEEKPRIRALWVLPLIALVLASVLASLLALSPGGWAGAFGAPLRDGKLRVSGAARPVR